MLPPENQQITGHYPAERDHGLCAAYFALSNVIRNSDRNGVNLPVPDAERARRG